MLSSCTIPPADGWTTDDVIYVWKYPEPVQFVQNLFLPGGFELHSNKEGRCDITTATGKTYLRRKEKLFPDLVKAILARRDAVILSGKAVQSTKDPFLSRHSLRTFFRSRSVTHLP